MATEKQKADTLNTVKFRNGIFYSNELIDKDVQTMIDECREHLMLSGVTERQLDSSPLTITACALWYKIARGTSTQDMTSHPVIISCICQLRNKVVEEECL